MARLPPSHNAVIAAVATAPGRGGIGVVRVSGPDLEPLIQGILGRSLKPRQASYARFVDAQGETLDEGIALYFPAPHSFTGENVLELQGHGGPQVLQLVLERCLELGARPAEPGEFSRRAFLNDKIDLAQAESIADLIDAQSREAARSAVRSLTGEFSARIHELVDALIHLRMLVEATLDFPEEEIDFLNKADAFGQLDRIDARLAGVLAQAKQGALLREGLNVVLIGQPNVGKSSLLNRLAGFEAAIVTEYAGTTRDALREAIQIDGVPLHITDTAGLRATDDPVEKIGIARTWEAVARSDVALLLTDAAHGVGEHERVILERLPDTPRLTVHNKIDVTGEPARFADNGPGSLALRQDRRRHRPAQAPPARTRRLASRRRRQLHGPQAPPRAPCAAAANTSPRHDPRCAISNCSPKNCASPRTPSAKSPANSAPTTCWARYSAGFVLASDRCRVGLPACADRAMGV
jgi:tRNA modification GTPase